MLSTRISIVKINFVLSRKEEENINPHYGGISQVFFAALKHKELAAYNEKIVYSHV